MKKINTNNSGFTLVELIIAMVVLAFLMTAVGSLMGSSVLTHKKAKAEIQVHSSAQAAYNQVTDSVMQAKEVVLIGYESSTPIDFNEPGAETSASTNIVVYVKDDDMKNFILADSSVYGTSTTDGVEAGGGNVRLFSQFDKNNYFYVKKLVVLTAAPIDANYAPEIVAGQTTWTVEDKIFKNNVTITEKGTSGNGTVLYDTYDNVVNIYTFEGNCMYYEKKYSFMTDLNDLINPAVAASKESCIYNDGFSYAVTTGTAPASISACTAVVDAKSGSLGIEFQFDDKNMTYTTNGMVSARNSYVFMPKAD